MSIDYYNQNAQEFYDDTVSVDMEALYAPFFEVMPRGGHILDAGCGSGRDSKAFLEKGYRVTAFDASEEMVKMASELTGLKVALRTFDDIDEVEVYDGIWACASLLHVQLADLPTTCAKLARSLKTGGVLYASFKCGEGERTKGERKFTDINIESLLEVTDPLPISLEHFWETDDSRNDRDDKWLNALFFSGSDPNKKL